MIEVTGLTKIFGQRTAIQDLNFKIDRGEIVGFLGANGAGKSTTMKILSAILPASYGQAKVAGFDVFSQALEVKRNVGYLPEIPPVYLDMQVDDYLRYAAQLHYLPKSRLKSAVGEVLERTGLAHVRGRLIGNLSKGYRQRVGIAQALVHDPQVLILDEPTVGLDPTQIIEVRELIKSLAGKHTVLFSSHILPEVTAICSRVIMIHQGSLVAEQSIGAGTRLHLWVAKPAAAGIAALQGLPGIRSIEPIAAGGSPGRFVIEVDSASADPRARILELAQMHQMQPLELYTDDSSLEDLFLNTIRSHA